ncbi:MAG: GspE/PulE family protein [Alphaproteobacteria bacterium]
MSIKRQAGDIQQEIAEALLARGALKPEQLARATSARSSYGGRVDQALTQLGLVADRDMAMVLAQVLELPLAAPENFPVAPVWPGRLSPSFLRKARILPLAVEDDQLWAAMADPLDEPAREALVLAAGATPRIFVAIPADIDAALQRIYGKGENSVSAGPSYSASTGHLAADVQQLREQGSDAAAVRLVNQLIAGAITAHASDIHIEPFDGSLTVRYRIDGVLAPVAAPDFSHYPAIIGRIKVLSGLDMAERRKPQDGRCLISVEGRRVDLRVSLLPALHGEGVVLRVLDQTRAPLNLGLLGFGPEQQAHINALISKPHGIMLVCGPTGSGKTTTLYAILRQLQNEQTKIVSVEDPVEYQIEGVNQIQVRPQIGLGFSEILRATLRHDPDVIMVGEARDSETARIAIQAALTGHLVLCSLHTNDAAGAVARLLDMGIEPYLLASTLRGVVAQRLVRKLCPLCRVEDVLSGRAGRDVGLLSGTKTWGPGGCPACRHTGYSGRTVVAEYIPADETLQNLILARADSAEIQRVCGAAGMRTLHGDGLAKVAQGITSLEEVMRVSAA